MISTRKLIKMAKKWQRKAAIARKRISFPRNYQNANTSASSTSPLAEKGHVVYTTDQKRSVERAHVVVYTTFPIAYLNNNILRELLLMAKEEFGLPSDGPITLPCEAVFMDYLISLIHRQTTKDIEKALLVSISAYSC